MITKIFIKSFHKQKLIKTYGKNFLTQSELFNLNYDSEIIQNYLNINLELKKDNINEEDEIVNNEKKNKYEDDEENEIKKKKLKID
jgi:hypothetical protein